MVDNSIAGQAESNAAGVAGVAGSRVTASLSSLIPPATVWFDFNPSSIQLGRSTESKYATSLSPEANDTVLLQLHNLKITLNDVRFEGMLTKAKCDQLFNWQTPGGSYAGRVLQQTGAARAAMGKIGMSVNLWKKLPALLFAWGPPMAGFMYHVRLAQVNVTYERFKPNGIPTRAKATLHLTVQDDSISTLPTNPTSGGLPGRREHVVTQGENLPSIAVKYFGEPGAWRPIAAINRIKDPMRLRPGQRVFIPHPDEFATGGAQ